MKREKNLINMINSINDDFFCEKTKINTLDQEEQYNSVSELQMHKILYILYGNFYRTFSKELFEKAKFQAWTWGPVEYDYRYALKILKNENNNEGYNKIIDKFNISDLSEEEYIFLDKKIRRLLNYHPWALVEFTHQTNAWIKNYSEGVKNKSISIEDIKKDFAK